MKAIDQLAEMLGGKEMGTRERILLTAMGQVHQYGFQAVSIQNIIDAVGITKGAFYHHFSSKSALGVSLVNECIFPFMHKMWIDPIKDFEDPLEGLLFVTLATRKWLSPEELKNGCPAFNLAQEMSLLDEEMRVAVNGIFERWKKEIGIQLERGVANEFVRANLDIASTSQFILASIEGTIGLSKSAQSFEIMDQCGKAFSEYLSFLRNPKAKSLNNQKISKMLSDIESGEKFDG